MNRDAVAGWAAILLVVLLALFCATMADRHFDGMVERIEGVFESEDE